MDAASTLPRLLLIAWLLPLVSFTAIVLAGPWMGKAGRWAAFLATGAIVSGFVLSLLSLCVWLGDPSGSDTSGGHTGPNPDAHAATTGGAVVRGQNPSETDYAHGDPDGHGGPNDLEGATAAGVHSGPGDHDSHGAGDHHEQIPPRYYYGDWYQLCEFGSLKLTIGYYIDALTVTMFCMVTLIASCIHFYAMGYMHEELEDVTDHDVTLSDGSHLHRPGRYYRFFQYLSLFCFSMLGLVVAGNIAMVFVFWELVGICSYFLIGFYIERKSACNAANKAFIVNRIGDFGMIIGLMALWSGLGTFAFGDVRDENGQVVEAGIFSQIRPESNHYQLQVPDGMVKLAAREEVGAIVRDHFGQPGREDAAQSQITYELDSWREQGYGYWLLVVAGLGIFCGCMGKSAQFPLHVWLPDAMEGPTPVSALVHSATMVAAGVFLVGRFYPAFTPEVLLTIAYVGCITLFLAATIAITATDIKRVLAYSTVSQLGYMMLALGVGGWLAGLFHLITHAFFKGLLFLCSGSVIHAVHTNEMPEMGGLRKKMPWTAYTMLVGCLAIIGAGIPPLTPMLSHGLSGYYSKDAILEQAWSFTSSNHLHNVLFYAAAGGAAITAFYMFRLWYMTFAGEPRNQERYDHAHESPRVMTGPLVILAVFAVIAGWIGVISLLEQARPAGTLAGAHGGYLLDDLEIPNEHVSHDFKVPVGFIAFGTALTGLLLATAVYAWRLVDPAEIRQQFSRLHRFLLNKWWFDELYDILFVRPTHFLSERVAQLDKRVIDGIVDGIAKVTAKFSRIGDLWLDQRLVDGSINFMAYRTWDLGVALRAVQSGKLRVYVVSIVACTIALWVLISYVRYAMAG